MAMKGDVSVRSVAPYYLELHIMPINFQTFWPLIWSIDQYKGTMPNTNQLSSSGGQNYEKTKWKLNFDRYIESIPPYYYDYINNYLSYLKVPSLKRASSDSIIFGNNNFLYTLTKDITNSQLNIQQKIEAKFLKNKKEHTEKVKAFDCCQNLK